MMGLAVILIQDIILFAWGCHRGLKKGKAEGEVLLDAQERVFTNMLLTKNKTIGKLRSEHDRFRTAMRSMRQQKRNKYGEFIK